MPDPNELVDYIPDMVAVLSVLIASLFSWFGGVRSAKTTEKVSLDTITKEIFQEYKAMKEELKADLEARLASECEARVAMQDEMDRRFEEVVLNCKSLQEYVVWCVGGHKPPPIEIPHRAMSELSKLYPKGNTK